MRLSKPFLVSLLLLLASALSVAQTQSQLPDTPAGRQCAAWLENFNRGDRDAFRAFLEKNYPSAVERLERSMDFRQRTGGFDFRKLEDSTPTKVVVVVQEHDSDQFARMTVEVEEVEPHHITSVGLQAIPRTPGNPEFQLPHLSQSELVVA